MIEILPIRRAIAITPDNDNDQTVVFREIYVGGAGAVKVDMEVSGTVTFAAVPVGTTLVGNFKRVYSTGTTATLLIGKW